MNIELIKSEIAKLSQLVASWSGEAEISSIERELALDKLKKLYDIVRFDTATIGHADTSIMAAASAVATSANDSIDKQQSDEQEVEVEFLFAEEEDEQEEDESEEFLTEEAVEENCEELIEEKEEQAEGQIAPEASEEEQTEEQTTPELPTEEQPEEQSTEVEPTEPEATEVPAKDDATEEPAKDEATEKPAKNEASQPTVAFMGNLFGMEEPKRHTRSKHLRMMSIYNDADTERQQTKSVDVSKIFDFEVNVEVSEPTPTDHTMEPATLPSPVTPKPAGESEKSTILADTIAANKQTLADTINTPAPLAEEITNAKISSLLEGVGINDKFLMIRDLFDGDDEAYATAIRDLDAEESFEDCMIYIVEHFEWNPDSEGAKFMMKLLERKHA